MALSDLISRVSINPLASSTSRLEAQLSEAETNLSNKRAALDALLTAGEIDTPNVSKADDACAAAERKVRNLRLALSAAQSKLATQQAETERSERRARWQGVVTAAERRHESILKLARSAEAFAQDYVRALELNNELYAALPAQMPDPDAALLHKNLIEISVRKELLRRGVSFAFDWPWGVASLPEFTAQFDQALDVIKGWAASQTR